MVEKILNGLRIWCLTLVIPIAFTIMSIFLLIIGIDFKEGENFLSLLRTLWIGYYFDGVFLGFVAWRIHLGLIFLCVLFGLLSED